MASISNGAPGEFSNIRPLQNGCIPKYKPRRRVSAVRDFPLLCGRNTVPVNLKPEEIRGSEPGPILANTFGSPEMAETIGPQPVGYSEADIKAESNEVVKDWETKTDTYLQNNVGCSSVKNSNIKVECKSHEALSIAVDVDMTEPLEALVGKITASANLDENPSALPPGFQLPNEVEHQGHEAVNNPMEVERPESMDVCFGEGTTTATKVKESFMDAAENLITNGKLNEINALDGAKTDSPHKETEDRGQTLLNEINKVQPLTLVKKSGLEEAKPSQDSSVGVKFKYRTTTVSAVRDFPPYCGRNIRLPVEGGWAGGGVKLKSASHQSLPGTVLQDGTIRQITQTSRGKYVIRLKKAPVVNELTALSDGGAGGQPLLSGKSSGTLRQSNIQELETGDSVFHDEDMPEIGAPISAEHAGKDVVNYPGKRDERFKPLHSASSSNGDENRKIIYALMAEPNCSWKKAKRSPRNKHDWRMSGEKNEFSPSRRHISKAIARKSIQNVKSLIPLSKKRKKVRINNDGDDDGSPGTLLSANGESKKGNLSKKSLKQKDFEVTLPLFGPNSSGNGDARNKVRETLCLFHAICRKLLQKEEANATPEDEGKPGRNDKRVDLLAANAIKEQGKEVNSDKQILGDVPGVQVGDEFKYRVELAVVGIHRHYQNGIDSMKLENGLPVAVSIVSSGSYSDDLENADVLIYSGQGGNVVGKQRQQPQDQKLVRGNLALKNSIDAKTPVRVVRGWKYKVVDPLDPKPKLVTMYVYDGLYTVEKYWTETGPHGHGKQVFMFELHRNPGQPELPWKQLKKSNNARFRPSVCIMDISGRKEPFGIPAVNTIDDEKPPSFDYVERMMYPSWHKPVAPPGCDCTGRCSDSRKCRCAVRNGGEIPYNRNGALVETKLLVYECGPHCKCPPSCYNRVSQSGIRHQLEVFKTGTRGWGVRPLTSIPSGSFICEYAGELLKHTEADRRIGNDEYLFDIGQNLSDSSLNAEDQALSAELVEDGGYTIDACRHGNIGRFINHSCAPNLYAQNVIYDHDDMKMPHIMLFAMENIPPLKELTYHYNYSVDQIQDSDGNIKVKKCYCGAAECTGRMY
ncbi:Histone-lysine N-methyltransferase- H3 lysine-9 specific SUVH5 [Striga hermonthica]|uniref:Histone-lysine N-methyltransferase- H3 lysine-9 specific SUVH5 n=1 Tax=Striga hermonthica TaxID=68872 RepID=A0A9N7NUP4_STRHE|nr:Histone-lysine N-methyltransferase- H3 lysine-9 specific SUVH5 [Striga hermonthica]